MKIDNKVPWKLSKYTYLSLLVGRFLPSMRLMILLYVLLRAGLGKDLDSRNGQLGNFTGAAVRSGS